jgi:hypothetical protein
MISILRVFQLYDRLLNSIAHYFTVRLLMPIEWVIGVIGAIAAAGIAKVWVFGWTYSEMRTDRNFWRETAMKSMKHVDKTLGGEE